MAEQLLPADFKLAKGAHDSFEKGACLLELCPECGTPFAPTPERKRLCSRLCASGFGARAAAAANRVPIESRLWGRIEVAAPDCWEYQGQRTGYGYGSIRFEGQMQHAHRIAWVLTFGQIPDGLFVCHHCDNPPCCNPDHLFLGTSADNNADRHAKGRTVMPANGPDFWRNKTHCPAGHPYSGDNVRYRPDGRRRCAACYRERDRRRRAAERGS